MMHKVDGMQPLDGVSHRTPNSSGQFSTITVTKAITPASYSAVMLYAAMLRSRLQSVSIDGTAGLLESPESARANSGGLMSDIERMADESKVGSDIH